jgi:transcriptional regulator with XRE-family HTH domain
MRGSSPKQTILSEPVHADIGTRLRALRIARGLSVSELAALAGVSVGTVSQVERRKANLSISTLERLRRALSVPLSALFEADGATVEPAADDFVRRMHGRPVLSVANTGMLKELLSPHGDRDLQMMIITLPRDSGSREVLVGAGEKAGLVLEGAVVLDLDGRRVDLEAGDSFQFRSTAPHQVRNENDRVARLLWIMNTQWPIIHL